MFISTLILTATATANVPLQLASKFVVISLVFGTGLPIVYLFAALFFHVVS